MSHKVLSYDLGGTKVEVGVVDEKGKILESIRTPVILEQGKSAVIQQLADIGNRLLHKHKQIKQVGIASAGPLDPEKGLLLDPTNFKSALGETWGRVHLTKILQQKLKRPVFLENDAAAAMLAEHWIGAAKKYKNAMILTLGTGLGTGIICNGELVRAGRFLHPEGGHMIVKMNDETAPCGCGNFGCAEAFLSGKNFGRRAMLRLNNPELTAEDVANLARSGDSRAASVFQEYSEIMAIVLNNYVRMFCPEIVIFTGSFAAASDIFLPGTQRHLEFLLSRESKSSGLLPKLVVSKLRNEAGLIGGAYIAFTKKHKLELVKNKNKKNKSKNGSKSKSRKSKE